MPSGKQVYSDIEDKITEVEKDENNLRAQISELTDRIRSDSAEQESCYIGLANIYLPEMDSKSIEETLKGARQEVQGIFDKKNQRRTELEVLMDRLGGIREKFRGKLDKLDSELDEKAKERDDLMEKIDFELNSNDKYSKLKLKADQTQESLDQNKRRAEVFEDDAKRKLEAYESSQLFMYLVERGFGTERQVGNNLTRMLDKTVSKLVNFRKNKENYDFLNAMPQKIKDDIDHRQSSLDTLVDNLRDKEQAVSEKYGLPKVIEECSELTQTRDGQMEKIKELDTRHQNCMEEREQLDDKKGKYYNKAIQGLVNLLKGDGISGLMRRATETPDPRDDGIVGKIEQLTLQIGYSKYQINDLKKNQGAIVKKLKGLKDIEREFTSNDYESRRSVFDSDFDITTLLLAYLSGTLSSRQINSKIETSQHFTARRTYRSSSTYSSSRSSSYDSDSDSDSFGGFGGGGGFSSGGGFGGGGFSTGGGF